ncbi:ATP-dependent DNA helicase RecG [Bifidobacterium aquikefiri]|uniref:ATP-dependent DNA helicase RecG n=1 Tax=Bifidobacterium aquikefiri TaxID=1653207 RepID=UPI0023F2ACB4|nr:ATP-dependent DNA helicase RecG [Bifidobacterium aquikefiri]
MVMLDSAVSAVLSNKRRVNALKALGVMTLQDALTYYPFRVTDPVPIRHLRDAKVDQSMACGAQVRAIRIMPMAQRRGHRLEVIVEDNEDSSTASLVFFSYKKYFVDWMSTRLKVGSTIVLQGIPSFYNDRLQFTHPEIQVVGEDCPDLETGLSSVSRPRPVYHANSRISSQHIHDTILGILRLLASDDDAAGVNLQPKDIEDTVVPIIPATRLAAKIPDILPESIIQDNGLLHRSQAFLSIHEPDSVKAFKAALSSLRFEEAFVSQTALLRTKSDVKITPALPCDGHNADVLVHEFLASLPFALTQGQRDVMAEIRADMAHAYPMQRLLQGEVGSGKTIVSVAAMLRAVGADQQAVLIAPTQILAEQHFQTIQRLLGQKGHEATTLDNDSQAMLPQTSSVAADTATVTKLSSIPVVLLTGGMRLAQRRKALAAASSGNPCIVIATHAAFSKTFQAPNLGLVVIDEQHRFGVEQRNALRNKSEHAPHLLVMTATPIPRTAALTWFGDLDLSWLTELPGGRKPIRTTVIEEDNASMMAKMFVHIRQRIDAGERAYIVCPRIDEEEEERSEQSGRELAATSSGPSAPTKARYAKSAGQQSKAGIDELEFDDFEEFSVPNSSDDEEASETLPPLHSVTTIAARLSALPQFAGLSIATLTGRDDDETKNSIMHGFSSGEYPIIVATTVVEVGMDVPEATCIVVFDADRFGLSQLHQLRGRVGRGGKQSWAFFISRAQPDSIAAQRLAVIRDSTDGAEIAQADMELRGAGDVLGDAQSGGQSSLKLLRVITDATIIAKARDQAEVLLASDPQLKKEVQLAGAVLDFMRGNERFLTST